MSDDGESTETRCAYALQWFQHAVREARDSYRQDDSTPDAERHVCASGVDDVLEERNILSMPELRYRDGDRVLYRLYPAVDFEVLMTLIGCCAEENVFRVPGSPVGYWTPTTFCHAVAFLLLHPEDERQHQLDVVSAHVWQAVLYQTYDERALHNRDVLMMLHYVLQRWIEDDYHSCTHGQHLFLALWCFWVISVVRVVCDGCGSRLTFTACCRRRMKHVPANRGCAMS